MAKKYTVMNPRRATCPSGRDLVVLDGVRYSESDDYTPPSGKDIKWLVKGGFLKEVASGSKRAKGAAACEAEVSD